MNDGFSSYQKWFLRVNILMNFSFSKRSPGLLVWLALSKFFSVFCTASEQTREKEEKWGHQFYVQINIHKFGKNIGSNEICILHAQNYNKPCVSNPNEQKHKSVYLLKFPMHSRMEKPQRWALFDVVLIYMDILVHKSEWLRSDLWKHFV